MVWDVMTAAIMVHPELCPTVPLHLEVVTEPGNTYGQTRVVDGGEPDAIRAILEVEVGVREHADNRAAKVFEGMGIYAPTLGIIGAVLGLMAVMQNLADPSKLGQGIAAAFTATIYGIGLANLFFLPMAGKLKGIVAEQSQVREMIIEGMISIAQGENPRAMRIVAFRLADKPFSEPLTKP